jgi:hypothetical protein
VKLAQRKHPTQHVHVLVHGKHTQLDSSQLRTSSSPPLLGSSATDAANWDSTSPCCLSEASKAAALAE